MSTRGELRKTSMAMNTAETIELLKSAEVGRLGTAGPDGYPYVIAVNHVYEPVADGLGRIFFHCAVEGHKLDNIRFNEKVCFEADIPGEIRISRAPCGCTVSFKSAVAFGIARIVEDAGEKRKALGLLVSRFGAGNPDDMPEEAVASTCVVEITIDTLTGKRSL